MKLSVFLYFPLFSFIFLCFLLNYLKNILPLHRNTIFLMKKELGKWLLDVAKYVATAVLISSFLVV